MAENFPVKKPFKSAGLWKRASALMIFSMWVCLPAFSQEIPEKTIVRASLQKLTGDKPLNSFHLKIGYLAPREIPEEFRKPHYLTGLLSLLPDSVKDKSDSRQLLQTASDLERGQATFYAVDFSLGKVEEIHIALYPVTGKPDTNRVVRNLDSRSTFRRVMLYNPVWLLQHMLSDTVELEYTGKVMTAGQEHYVFRVGAAEKALEVFINAKSFLPERVVVNQVDKNPLFGKGPVHFRDIYIYPEYKEIRGFLLPEILEEIEDLTSYVVRKKLDWGDLNRVFPGSVFVPEPPVEEKLRYSVSRLSDNFFLLKEKGKYGNRHLLVRVGPNHGIDLFTNTDEGEKVNSKVRNAVKDHFPGQEIHRVFSPRRITGLKSASPLLVKPARLYAPRRPVNIRFFSSVGDSIQSVWQEEGKLVLFEAPFKEDGITGVLLNEDNNSFAFYFPEERWIYIEANVDREKFGFPAPSGNEIALYRRIHSDNLAVEKIIYSHAFGDNVPVQIDFREFEKKVQPHLGVR